MICASKQQSTADKSAEVRPAERVPLFAQKKRLLNDSRLCHSVPDLRTILEDYLKILEFIEWLKEYYPESATFLNKEIRL